MKDHRRCYKCNLVWTNETLASGTKLQIIFPEGDKWICRFCAIEQDASILKNWDQAVIPHNNDNHFRFLYT